MTSLPPGHPPPAPSSTGGRPCGGGAPAWVGTLNDGCLADIAPTILELMNLNQPVEMTGQSLIRARSPVRAAEPAEAAAE